MRLQHAHSDIDDLVLNPSIVTSHSSSLSPQ
jgi:hypothetical protein